MGPYNALNICSYIIRLMNEQGKFLDHLKLQKLLYFINLSWLNRWGYLATEESIEKWKLGPVIPEVYKKYKVHGSYQISAPIEQSIFDLDTFEINRNPIEEPDLTVEESDLINYVIEKIGDKDSFELVEETHRHRAWNSDEDRIVRQNIQGIQYSAEELQQTIAEALKYIEGE
jgi:uncharacterized phage-associated protein